MAKKLHNICSTIFYLMTCRILVNCRFGLSHCVLTNTYLTKSYLLEFQMNKEMMNPWKCLPANPVTLFMRRRQQLKLIIIHLKKVSVLLFMQQNSIFYLHFDRELQSKMHILKSIFLSFKVEFFFPE